MRRRTVLKSAGAVAATLAAPNLAGAQSGKVLKFVPQGDLALLDPIQTPLFATRNHALMVFDTLYGVDEDWKAQPQMVDGHVVGNDGKDWKLTLRDGLKFHDGTPVLARDVVASLRRWGTRDSFGRALLAVTDEISAPSDRVVEFRLKKPFPLLPDALGKTGTNIAVIMPERLAGTDAAVQVTEMVGSGPYKFLASERVPGARAVYERFAGYVPRPDGIASRMAGPKLVHFDRVEWLTIPDAGTAAAALQAGEIDWWEQPTADLWPLLKRNRNLTVEVTDTTGSYSFVRCNFLNPPFDNPAVRRAALAAISQTDVMQAMAGTDPAMWRDKVGFFLPGTPMASDAGIEAVAGPVDVEHVRRMLAASGYKGEKLAFLVATDYPSVSAQGEVGGGCLAPRRLQRRYAGPRRRHRRPARAQPAAGGQRGLECLQRLHGRRQHLQPRRPQLHPRQRQDGDLRLARHSPAGGAAQCLVRCPRPGSPGRDLPRDADRRVRHRPLSADRRVLPADRLPPRPDRHPARLRAILRGSSRLSCRDAPTAGRRARG